MEWKKSDNNRAYQAKRIIEMDNGKTLPTIEEIVTTIMINSTSPYKKEEIDEKVSQQTGYSLDASISSAVSGILQNLQKQKIISNIKHGYWEKL